MRHFISCTINPVIIETPSEKQAAPFDPLDTIKIKFDFLELLL